MQSSTNPDVAGSMTDTTHHPVVAYVEDEKQFSDYYTPLLKKCGFEVALYTSKSSALEAFQRQPPDIAVLDVALDNDLEAGIDICAEIRKVSQVVPIIFLTAQASDITEILGRRAGADDYITKQTSAELLIARIRSLLKRHAALTDSTRFQNEGSLRVDMSRDLIAWKGKPVDLTLTQIWITKCLAQSPGQVKSIRDLMKAAQTVMSDNGMVQHIRAIRKKFEAVDPEFDSIKTVHAKGYRWVEENG